MDVYNHVSHFQYQIYAIYYFEIFNNLVGIR